MQPGPARSLHPMQAAVQRFMEQREAGVGFTCTLTGKADGRVLWEMVYEIPLEGIE